MTDHQLSSPNDRPISENLECRFTGKCPINLQFPTSGRMEDNPAVVLREEERFSLSLDKELMVTLRNAQCGTARYWDVAQLRTHSWVEFQSKFLSAFLPEDYEDELVTKNQNMKSR